MLWIAILNYQQKVDKISGWPYKNEPPRVSWRVFYL